MSAVWCNGEPADAAALSAALVNYGHFTSLQVRDRAVQGLDLHLQRLVQATGTLFGTTLEAQQVRRWMAYAVEHREMADASMRVTVFSRAFDFREPLAAVPVDVLVAVGAPVQLAAVRAVRSIGYQREMPALKHVGTFGLFQQRRDAMAGGFDDALFLTADGLVSEGTTWNVAFLDGEQLVWPQAPALRGTAEALLQAHWQGPQVQRAYHAAELATATAAFACNASGIWPLGGIDGRLLPDSIALAERARRVMAAVAWQSLDEQAVPSRPPA
ncbi:aminotransferase class IV [Stenotrophomonas sp. WHRI 8082]|uniref:aminotransferase class IV n=1 Tax=Stenotrophomonas sp. WHRI 8082 TaxID=3162571 RepID=UPI0032EC604D